MANNQSSLLLVCTGNTCRSQMAHAMCVDICAKQGFDLNIASAGIRAVNGSPSTHHGVAVLANVGIDWQGFSQQLDSSLLNKADHVWVMTDEHLNYAQTLISARENSATPVIELLAYDQEVVDPLGLGLEAYEALYAQLVQLLPTRLAALCGPSAA